MGAQALSPSASFLPLWWLPCFAFLMASLSVVARACGAASVRRGAGAISNISRRTYTTLIIADHDNKSLNKESLHALTAASKLPGSEKIDLLVLGKACETVASEGAKIEGVSRVLLAESDVFEHPVADTMAEFLFALQQTSSYGVIGGVSSSICRETLPRVAAKLDVQPITDVVKVEADEGVFTRPMYAGNALATVKSNDPVKILTFRPTAFEAAAAAASPAPVETAMVPACEGVGITWVSDSEKASDKPQLSSASRVVAGGRGLKNAENFESLLGPLCDKLGAAMGASRAVVDAGFVPNEMQVGQTGKVVAPDLYVAVGISGAIQHLAGMKDSKTIVAINKDADAPIFQVADYGLVTDLFDSVPEITKKA